MGPILKITSIISTGDEVSSPAHNKIMTDQATGLLLYFTYFSLHVYPKCSLCIVDKDDVIPEEFTSYFRSVIVFGTAHFVESVDEKIAALRLLGDKYSPGIDPEAEIARFIKTVCILRIDIDCVTGKEAIELTQARTEK